MLLDSEPESPRAPSAGRSRAGTEMHPQAGKGSGSSTSRMGEETRDLPGTSCSTSSYFNIYRMLSPLKCKIVLLSPYVQIFYKCRYARSI